MTGTTSGTGIIHSTGT